MAEMLEDCSSWNAGYPQDSIMVSYDVRATIHKAYGLQMDASLKKTSIKHPSANIAELNKLGYTITAEMFSYTLNLIYIYTKTNIGINLRTL